MFTQKITMDCTYQQFHDILEQELLLMGYEIQSISHWNLPENCFITNNYLDYPVIGNIHQSQKGVKGKYLGQFNPDLFLALAAMTNNQYGNYGEYWTFYSQYVDPGSKSLHRQKAQKSFIGVNSRLFYKSTVDEIMEKFNRPEYNIDSLHNLLNISEKLINEVFSEPLLKDLLTEEDEKLAIEFLKSKNYKILKKEEKWIEI